MKKVLLSALMAVPAFVMAQVPIFSEDFDNYNDQDWAGVVSPWMSSWTGVTGQTPDCQVTNAESSSAPNSIMIFGPQGGGAIDAMIAFPGDYTSGRFEFRMKLKVATGKGGYFNLQSSSAVPGTAWLGEAYFASDSTGTARLGGQAIPFNYPNGAWIDILVVMNIDADIGHFYIDGNEVGTGFQISLESNGAGVGDNMSFGGVNLYSYAPQAPAVGDCEYYVDDISLVETTALDAEQPVLSPAMNVVPNPSTGNFSLNFKDLAMENASITLTDVLGKTVYSGRACLMGSGVLPFHLNLRNGVYFIAVTDGVGRMTRKIIVRK